MAWVAVNKDGKEGIFGYKPYRKDPVKSIYKLWEPEYWSDEDVDRYGNEDTRIELPKGSIKKLIGRELSWENEPVELKADTVEKITIDVEDYCRYLSYANYIENWAGTIYKCPRCGALNPEGYNCMECGYMKLSYE